MICSTYTRIAILLAFISWYTPTGTAAVDPTPAPVYWGTEIEVWRAPKGRLSLDRENFKSRDSSVRFDESGVYEITVTMEPFARISTFAFMTGKSDILINAYLRDRDGVRYEFPSLSLPPQGRWGYFDLEYDSLFLPRSSIDPNHRFDFPATALGFDVKIPEGGKINIDRIHTVSVKVSDQAKHLTADRLARWDERLRGMDQPQWRPIPGQEDRPTLTPSQDSMRVTGARYTANVDARTGALTRVEFGPDGSKPLDLSMKPVWEVVTWEGRVIPSGNVKTTQWDDRRGTLVLEYETQNGVKADFRYAFHPDRIEMDVRIENGGREAIRWVHYPGSLTIPADSFDSVLWPRRGGVELSPKFFQEAGTNRTTYPAESFANWTGISMKGRFMALSGLETSSFFHPAEFSIQGDPQTGNVTYRQHRPAYIPSRTAWVFPAFVLWMNENRWTAIQAYREATGIAASPSLAEKLGREKFDKLGRSMLLPWNMEQFRSTFASGVFTFQESVKAVGEMSSPVLVLPQAYLRTGAAGNVDTGPVWGISDITEFLPASRLLGGETAFQTFLLAVRGGGNLAAGELNPSMWDPRFFGYGADDPNVATSAMKGTEPGDAGADRTCPYHPKVRECFEKLTEMYKTRRPVDFLLVGGLANDFDFLDLSQAGPHPIADTAGWIHLVSKASETMPEMIYGGFDFIVPDVVGVSGVEEIEGEGSRWDEDTAYGPGNWKVFPLEAALAHDKIAFYRFRPNPNKEPRNDIDLAGSLALGYNLYLPYPGDENWLRMGQMFQETVGSRILGEPLVSFDYLAENVTRSMFGKVEVIANHDTEKEWSVDQETRILPGGFYVADEGKRFQAGTFLAYSGQEFDLPRYLVEERTAERIYFRDAFPDGSRYLLKCHRQWTRGKEVQGFVRTSTGSYAVKVVSDGDSFEFEYPDFRNDKEKVLGMYFQAR